MRAWLPLATTSSKQIEDEVQRRGTVAAVLRAGTVADLDELVGGTVLGRHTVFGESVLTAAPREREQFAYRKTTISTLANKLINLLIN